MGDMGRVISSVYWADLRREDPESESVLVQSR